MSGEGVTPSEPISPEALAAYENGHVIAAVRASDWFTPEYIRDVNSNEPELEREGSLGPLKDKFLADFFMVDFEREKYLNSDEFRVYLATRRYLRQRMVGTSGHPFVLNEIEFVDEKLLAELSRYDVQPNREVERGMVFEIEGLIQCIIAPEPFRRKVTQAICSWGDDYLEREKDVIVWSQVTRAGALSFISTRWNQGAKAT